MAEGNVKQVKPKVKSTDKVIVVLKPAGRCPKLAKEKWQLSTDKTLAYISTFIRNSLEKAGTQTESLFLYVKQTFAPPLDTELGQLCECYGSDNKLVLHYCDTEAWG